MSREAGQFGEGFDAVRIRATPSPSPSPLPMGEGQGEGRPLTPEDLAALLCRIPYVRLDTGEEGEVVLSAADWRGIMDRHELTVTRTRRMP